MTKYEALKHKADACRRAGSRSNMKRVWQAHAEALERQLANLTIEEAMSDKISTLP